MKDIKTFSIIPIITGRDSGTERAMMYARVAMIGTGVGGDLHVKRRK